MIYTNKMRIFLYKNTLRYKNTKKLMLTTSTKGRCNTSHGRARTNTDTQNISVDQCNQWEIFLPQTSTDEHGYTEYIYILGSV